MAPIRESGISAGADIDLFESESFGISHWSGLDLYIRYGPHRKTEIARNSLPTIWAEEWHLSAEIDRNHIYVANKISLGDV